MLLMFCPQGPITQHRALPFAFLLFGCLFLKKEELMGRGALAIPRPGLGQPYTQTFSVLFYTGILPAVMIIIIMD